MIYAQSTQILIIDYGRTPATITSCHERNRTDRQHTVARYSTLRYRADGEP